MPRTLTGSNAGKPAKVYPASMWRSVRADWENDMPGTQIASKYSISPDAILKKSRTEGWTKPSYPTGSAIDFTALFNDMAEEIYQRHPNQQSIWSKARLIKIFGALYQGMSKTAAAQLAGVNRGTFQRWMTEYQGLVDGVAVAQRMFYEKNLQRIDRVAQNDWHAARWLLETNEETREEVKPAVEEKKVVFEFAFSRSEMLPAQAVDAVITPLISREVAAQTKEGE